MTDFYVAPSGSTPTPAGVWDGHYTDVDTAAGDALPGDRLIIASNHTDTILRNSSWGGVGTNGELPIVLESAQFDSDPLIYEPMTVGGGLLTINASPWLWWRNREYHGITFGLPSGCLVQGNTAEIVTIARDCRFQGAWDQFQIPDTASGKNCRFYFQNCHFVTTRAVFSRVFELGDNVSGSGILKIENCTFDLTNTYSRIVQNSYGYPLIINGIPSLVTTLGSGSIVQVGSAQQNRFMQVQNVNVPSGWTVHSGTAIQYGDELLAMNSENAATYPGGRPIEGWADEHQTYHGLQTYDLGNYRSGGAQMGAGNEFSMRIQKQNNFSGTGDLSVGRLSPFTSFPQLHCYMPANSTAVKVHVSSGTSSSNVNGQNFWVEMFIPKGANGDAGYHFISSRGVNPAADANRLWDSVNGGGGSPVQQATVDFDLTALGAVPLADCQARWHACWCGGQDDVVNVCPAAIVS